MANFRTFLLLMQVVPGLLLIGLAVPLIRRKVPPNHWYGFRVPRTLADPGVWSEANASSGRCLRSAGLVMVVGSMALFEVAALDGPAYAVACTVLSLGAVGSAVVLSFRFLGRIAGPAAPSTQE